MNSAEGFALQCYSLLLGFAATNFIPAHTFSTDDRLLTHHKLRLCCVMLRHVQPTATPCMVNIISYTMSRGLFAFTLPPEVR